jgi:hypothetical protein
MPREPSGAFGVRYFLEKPPPPSYEFQFYTIWQNSALYFRGGLNHPSQIVIYLSSTSFSNDIMPLNF